jgi:predicted esterase
MEEEVTSPAAAASASASAAAPATPSSSPSPRPRILCLHGWTQNADVLRQRCGTFSRKMARVADLTWATAPHHLPPSLAGARENARAWWSLTREDPTDTAGALDMSRRREYVGWPESRQYLAGLWLQMKEGGREAEGAAESAANPHLGLFGFSQGAVAIHRLLTDIEIAERLLAAASSSPAAPPPPPPPPPPRGFYPFTHDEERAFLPSRGGTKPSFAILCAGFPSRDLAHVPQNEEEEGAAGKRFLFPTPSLHLSGSNDTTVDPSYQRLLAADFLEPLWRDHDKGHSVPQNAEDMKVIMEFVAKHGGPPTAGGGEEEGEGGGGGSKKEKGKGGGGKKAKAKKEGAAAAAAAAGERDAAAEAV